VNKAEGLARMQAYAASDEVVKLAIQRCDNLPFEELKLVLKLVYASNRLRSGSDLGEAEKLLNEITQSAEELGASLLD
jgi:hypothetical protein